MGPWGFGQVYTRGLGWPGWAGAEEKLEGAGWGRGDLGRSTRGGWAGLAGLVLKRN